MADTAEKTAEDKLKDYEEKLKALLEVLAPAKPDATDAQKAAKTSPVDAVYGPVSLTEVDTFAKQATGAAERYRNAMRWLVGAVAVIGLTLFGSSAFAAGNPFASRWGVGGLLVASIGLVTVLAAATSVFEPEDASLGELLQDITVARARFAKTGLWSRVRRLLSWRLWTVFKFDEVTSASPAHFGGHDDLQQFVNCLGDKTKDRKAAYGNLVQAKKDTEGRTKIIEQHLGVLKILVDKRKTFDPQTTAKFTADTLYDPRILATMGALDAEFHEGQRAAGRIAECQATLDTLDCELGSDLLHRDLLLWESCASQMRGKFQASRVWLLVGSMLTLFGALAYLVGVKASSDKGQDEQYLRAGTLTVAPATVVADLLKPPCVGTPLHVVLFSKDMPANSAEFTVTITAPETCAGPLTVPGDRYPNDVVIALDPAIALPS